jgi:hypothetical protein
MNIETPYECRHGAAYAAYNTLNYAHAAPCKIRSTQTHGIHTCMHAKYTHYARTQCMYAPSSGKGTKLSILVDLRHKGQFVMFLKGCLTDAQALRFVPTCAMIALQYWISKIKFVMCFTCSSSPLLDRPHCSSAAQYIYYSTTLLTTTLLLTSAYATPPLRRSTTSP